MKKLLFVSYNHSDPKVADSVQNHRLIPALSDYYDVDIVQRCIKRNEDGIWSPNLYIIDRIIYKIFPFLISVFSLDRWFWCKIAFRHIKNALSKYSAVIIVYEPYTIRFLHYSLKQTNKNIKLISVLYDPYVDNLFFSQSRPGLRLRGSIEKKIVTTSDLVVVNSKMLLETIQTRYDNCRISYVPFCASPVSYEKDSPKNRFTDGKLHIVHAGNIHGKRHLKELNEIVTLVKSLYKEGNLADILQINMFGFCPEEEVRLIEQSKNDDVVKFNGYVKPNELHTYEVNSDALLLINPTEGDNYSYPSKLCEYFQLNKIILSIGSANSACNNDLQEAGHIVSKGSAFKEITDAILSLISEKEKLDKQIDKYFYKRFLPDHVARNYYNLIDPL